MTDNGFGYIKVENGKIKVYYGDSSNPSIMSFDNPEMVEAINEYKKIKEKWDGFVKLSREGFYVFDMDREFTHCGIVKREKIDQNYKLLSDKINECIRLKAQIEELKGTIQTMKYDAEYMT